VIGVIRGKLVEIPTGQPGLGLAVDGVPPVAGIGKGMGRHFAAAFWCRQLGLLDKLRKLHQPIKMAEFRMILISKLV
jgi:hypothetical protein